MKTRTGASASPYPCPATLAGMDALSSGSTVRMFSLNVGDTDASDEGLDGYLDKVVVSLASGTTTFDFEPYEVADTKDDCKNGGWESMSRADGTGFKNQGDCIQYVNTGK